MCVCRGRSNQRTTKWQVQVKWSVMKKERWRERTKRIVNKELRRAITTRPDASSYWSCFDFKVTFVGAHVCWNYGHIAHHRHAIHPSSDTIKHTTTYRASWSLYPEYLRSFDCVNFSRECRVNAEVLLENWPSTDFRLNHQPNGSRPRLFEQVCLRISVWTNLASHVLFSPKIASAELQHFACSMQIQRDTDEHYISTEVCQNPQLNPIDLLTFL